MQKIFIVEAHYRVDYEEHSNHVVGVYTYFNVAIEKAKAYYAEKKFSQIPESVVDNTNLATPEFPKSMTIFQMDSKPTEYYESCGVWVTQAYIDTEIVS